jgi:NADH-quinone oxidoreductase subunit J
MNILFYLSAVVAVIATFLVITRTKAVHALLYLIVSLLAVALIFFILGAPFAAALEVIIYAGAIMVLFIFVMMMLNLGGVTAQQESQWLKPGIWWGPALLCALLALELLYFFAVSKAQFLSGAQVPPKQVGIALFGPYALGVELASMLLLAGLVGAYHLGRKE